jgi:hypothetical protein
MGHAANAWLVQHDGRAGDGLKHVPFTLTLLADSATHIA